MNIRKHSSNTVKSASPPAENYRDELRRTISPFQSFAVAFGFVSIATGIFTTYGAVLNSSGPMGIWTWPIVVLGQLMVALLFGSLSARIPVTGYVYQWMSRLTNPVLGWMMGWLSFTFLIIVTAAVDYTIASTILPVTFGYVATLNNTWGITAVVMVLQAIMIACSTSFTQRFNGIAVTIQLVGMLSLVVLLFGAGYAHNLLDFSRLFDTGSIARTDYFSLGTLTHAGPFVLGTLLGAFTIVGFESAANLAEETHEPERVVPKAMWQAVLSLGIIGFLFLVAVTALAKDPTELARSGTPVADVIYRVLGPVTGNALLVLVIISIFSCGLVIMLSSTRLVWAMSRDARFPGHQILHKVDPTHFTPRNATVFSMLIAQVVLATFSQDQSALFTLFGAATLLPAMIYAATVIMYIAKRKQLPESRGFKLGIWETPVICLAVIWLAFELFLFRDEQFRGAWSYIALMCAIGGTYLAYLLLTRGRQGLTMPDMISIDSVLDHDARSVLNNDVRSMTDN
ncbi:amino acid permease [Salmonella enterica]|nr:amino acid permease [Salmonella enterica]EGZ4033031.1 amino acid permease [Salmonella enterica subsp. enterica serovar Javiana]HCX7090143.1 amino acid permease [Salmonella enterica subsp. enterica]ECE1413823.1 amino acid permease [Salmonella enterica]ELS7235321.1 amino acid permease [Salmonella enterica]